MSAHSSTPPTFRSAPVWSTLWIILAVPTVGISLLPLLYMVVANRTTRLTISENRIKYETGIFNKVSADVEVSKVRSVMISETLINRMFGVGTVEVYTSGDLPEISASGHLDPHGIKKLITDMGGVG